jgi:hypothetical protein
MEQESDSGAETSGTGSTTTPPFQNPLGQGNLVLVWVFYQTDAPDVQLSGVTDGVNQYTLAAGPLVTTVTPSFKQEIWYGNNINAVVNAQISVSFQGSTPPTEVQISAHEYTNAYQENDTPLGPLADQPPPGTAGASSDDPGNPNNLVLSDSLTTNGRLVFAAAWFAGSGVSQPPYNTRSTIKSNVVEDTDVTTPGVVVQAVFKNTSPARGWMAQMITLK